MFESKKSVIAMNKSLATALEEQMRINQELEAKIQSLNLNIQKLESEIESLESESQKLMCSVFDLCEQNDACEMDDIISQNQKLKNQENNTDLDPESDWDNGGRSFCKILLDVIKVFEESGCDTGALYNCLAGKFDRDGYMLYNCTGYNVSRSFPYEDSLGYFENLNGHGLFEWVIGDKFGGISYSQIPNSSYESIEEVDFTGQEENIENYHKDCEKEVVDTILICLQNFCNQKISSEELFM